MSVTDNQNGTTAAQDGQSTPQNDPTKSQFGGQVSSDNTDRVIADAVHKVKSELGREHRQAIDKLQEELYRDDPESLQKIRLKQDADRKIDEANIVKELAEAKSKQAEEVLSRALAIESKMKATELAGTNGVDLDQLLKLSDGRIEKMEELAPLLPKISAQAAQPQRPTLRVDSGNTVANANQSLDTLLQKDTRRMNQAELLEHKKDLEAITKGMPL